MDDFEEFLTRQPVRQAPPAWREDILAAARRAAAPAPQGPAFAATNTETPSPMKSTPAPKRPAPPPPVRGFWLGLFTPQMGFAATVFVAAGFAGGWALSHREGPTNAVAQNRPGAAARPTGARNPGAAALLAQRPAGDAMKLIFSDQNYQTRMAKLSNYAASLDTAGCLAALELVKDNSRYRGGDYDPHSTRQVLLARLTELDPSAALEWAQAMPRTYERTDALRAVFSAWGANDTAPLFAAVETVGNLHQRRELLGNALEALAVQNPTAALEYMGSLPAGARQPDFYRRIFDKWARTNPAAAAEAVVALPNGNARNQALEAIGYGWAQTDPAGALAWAQTLPQGQARMNLESNILSNIAQSDPKAVLAYLDNVPSNNMRMNLMQTATMAWAQTEPAAALAWVQEAGLSPQMLQNILPGILSQAAQKDPAGAAVYAADLPPGAARNNALANIASVWAENDPAAAMAWAESLPAPQAGGRGQGRGNNPRTMVLNQWANNDPAGAAAYVQAHLDDPTVARAASNIASQLAQFDPAAAIEFANQLTGNARTQAIANVISQQANIDPESAWAYIQALPTGEQNYQNLAQNVVQQWAYQDPATVSAVAITFPEGNQRRNAVNAVAGAWLNQDPMSASQWIAGLENGPSRDAAVSQLVSSQAMYEPELALQWAMTIDNERQRNQQVLNAARTIYRADPNLAQQVFQNAGFSEGDAANLIVQAQSRNTGVTGRPGPGVRPMPAIDPGIGGGEVSIMPYYGGDDGAMTKDLPMARGGVEPMILVNEESGNLAAVSGLAGSSPEMAAMDMAPAGDVMVNYATPAPPPMPGAARMAMAAEGGAMIAGGDAGDITPKLRSANSTTPTRIAPPKPRAAAPAASPVADAPASTPAAPAAPPSSTPAAQ